MWPEIPLLLRQKTRPGGENMSLLGFDVDVECRHCGHTWTYRGKTPYAQCPRCQKSNNLTEILELGAE